ncbi:MAG TPA: MBL fold metallo-hydrolase [Lentisphaeria bacterium]|nr:MAG: MBL fold metallo-hydrolase [Lentisphaerae bacterium GWF2_38_69]HBM16752.1 MBL fold metallo-hydrolase [Lentisphaeria bacterium]
MKLNVLIDNNTLIDRYFLGEPGVSYLIQDEDKQILFDTGYSNTFITNARKLNLNLMQSDFIVLSHGHMDHTWGLDGLIKLYTEAKIESLPYQKPTLVTHPETFQTKTADGIDIGCILTESMLHQHFEMKLSKKPFHLTDRLIFLGEIERLNDFENKEPVGKVHFNSKTEDDFLLDDSALAYKGKNGLVIITGCSHSGICNIIQYAKKVCNEDKVIDVIGGFHLMKPSKKQLSGTLDYFKKLKAKEIHACHCVDLTSKISLSKAANLKDVGVGLSLNYK